MNKTTAAAVALLAGVVALAPACGGGATKTGAVKPVASVSEWKVALSQSTFKTGKYDFTIKNDGKIEHELIALKTDLAPSALPVDSEGNINEDAPGLANATDGEDIAAGATQARTVDLATPGTYVFMCNLPGHFKAGMFEVVRVSFA